MIKTLIVASCIALTSSSQLSMAGASQIEQASATNLSGVVLAHISKYCRDSNNRDSGCVKTSNPNVIPEVYKHGKGTGGFDCFKGHYHHEGGGSHCCKWGKKSCN